MTWGWVNYKEILIWKWTNPLSSTKNKHEWNALKFIKSKKRKVCHHSLTLMLFQTHITFFFCGGTQKEKVWRMFMLFFSIVTIKGIVHTKMKILSSFTHPQVVPNLYERLCSAEHKGRYSEECGKQSSSGAPLTSIVFFFLLWKSMVPQNSLVTNFLQNIFLCVQQNKEMHTGLELLEGE